MRIRVRYNYRGKPSQERVIEAGDYEDSDPRLFGLAQYLVKNGHAVILKDAPVTLQPEIEIRQPELPDVPQPKPRRGRSRTQKAE